MGSSPSAPTDLRTFARKPTIPQEVTNVSIYDKAPEPYSKARTPPRLAVLEGNILDVFILKVGVLVDVETLRCGACHPEFLYVTGTERLIQEAKQRVLRPQILCHLFAPVVQDACQVLDLAGVGPLPETIRIPSLCQMLAQVKTAIHMERERIIL